MHVAFAGTIGTKENINSRGEILYLYFSIASKISKICRDNNTLFIVNDRVDIAMLSGAHGVHCVFSSVIMARI